MDTPHKVDLEEAFKYADELVNRVEIFLDEIGSIKSSDASMIIVAQVSIGLFNKILRTYKAITILCKNGLDLEAHALQRVLIETMATLSMLHKEINEDDAENKALERTQRYLAYSFFHDNGTIQTWKNHSVLNLSDEVLEKNKKEQIDFIKKRFPDLADDQKRKKMWKCQPIILDGPEVSKKISIETIFKTVGLEVAYLTAYRACSKHIHADDFDHYIDINTKDEVMCIPNSISFVTGLISISGLFTLQALQVITLALKIDNETAIKRNDHLYQKIEKYFAKVSQSGTKLVV